MDDTSQIGWDLGTAYDMFISLWVLHEPAEFGVRGAWAAGVRARLPSADREVLEQGLKLFHVPFHWIHSLPSPKDSAAVLWSLGQLPLAERLPALALSPGYPSSDVVAVLEGVAARGAWNDDDREGLRAAFCCPEEKEPPSDEKLELSLSWWSRTEEFGERFLEALRVYQEVFFAEEEKRIQPALESALARAQELAQELPLADLLEELSQGIRFDELLESAPLVLAPSYWSTPLVLFGESSISHKMFLFGARPADASLVPGEVVPDSLLRVLKALSDPTRLRIMHYLTGEALSPAELSRRLRLRAPTVTHHLKILRLAGLVQVTLGESKEQKRYAVRQEAVAAACDALKNFLERG